ncbi:MAG: ATP-binding protein [Planctomycetes bacterium]|nr:ATP-binding protein [Planctomycetota bacterium]
MTPQETTARETTFGETTFRARVFSLTLPSDLSMLSVARNFVENLGQACSLERPTLHAVVLATGEAITNIVRHAHRELPAAQIHIQIEVESDSVALIFLDQGEPFDLTAVPHLNPGETRIGGRGVFLMRTLMDEVTCEPRGSEGPGNRLRLVKFRPPHPQISEIA